MISFTLCLLLAAWIGLAILVARLDTPLAKGLQRRMATLLGSALILGAFFFEPWVKFEFADYFINIPEFVNELVPGLVEFLIRLLGDSGAAKFIHILSSFTSLNGWQIQIVPTLPIGARISIVLPSIVAFLTLVWLPIGATFRGNCFGRGMGILQIVLGLLGIIALVLCLPEIDALGLSGNFQWGLLATILGVHASRGPWVTMLGLGAMSIGGWFEYADQGSTADSVAWEDKWERKTWDDKWSDRW